MQFTTVLALAATALAIPNAGTASCTLGQYTCTPDGTSIQQCDISGKYVLIGACPKGDYCAYDRTNKLPYCYGPHKKERRQDVSPPWCETPGTYSCTADSTGINVCNTQNQLVLNGPCPANTYCEPLESASGQPFCVADN